MDNHAIAKRAEEYMRLLKAGRASAAKVAEMVRFLKSHGMTLEDRDHEHRPNDRA